MKLSPLRTAQERFTKTSDVLGAFEMKGMGSDEASFNVRFFWDSKLQGYLPRILNA
jgi:hypothetical protein